MKRASRSLAIACAALLIVAGCRDTTAFNKGYADGASWGSSHPNQDPKDTDIPFYNPSNDPNDPGKIFQTDYKDGFRHGVTESRHFKELMKNLPPPPLPAPKEHEGGGAD